MSKYKKSLSDLKKDIINLKTTFEDSLILGPVGYLEECEDLIDAALEELEAYEETGGLSC